jgi:hypothetical protein
MRQLPAILSLFIISAYASLGGKILSDRLGRSRFPGQANIIIQGSLNLHSPYVGANSFPAAKMVV